MVLASAVVVLTFFCSEIKYSLIRKMQFGVDDVTALLMKVGRDIRTDYRLDYIINLIDSLYLWWYHTTPLRKEDSHYIFWTTRKTMVIIFKNIYNICSEALPSECLRILAHALLLSATVMYLINNNLFPLKETWLTHSENEDERHRRLRSAQLSHVWSDRWLQWIRTCAVTQLLMRVLSDEGCHRECGSWITFPWTYSMMCDVTFADN